MRAAGPGLIRVDPWRGRRAAASAGVHSSAHAPAASGVVVLGGLMMKQRALEKIAATLYPDLPAAILPHSLLQLVNVHTFARNTDVLRRALFPGGTILHILSGSAFFTCGPFHALAQVRSDDRIRGIVLDSVPHERIEERLLQVAGVPRVLCPPLGALASVVLTSPLFGATRAYTDAYNVAQRDPATFAPVGHVLAAHSVDDAVIPVREFRAWRDDVRARSDWVHAEEGAAEGASAARGGNSVGAGGSASPAPARVRLTTYEGKGMHAGLARDDPAFAAAVRAWRATIGMPQEALCP